MSGIIKNKLDYIELFKPRISSMESADVYFYINIRSHYRQMAITNIVIPLEQVWMNMGSTFDAFNHNQFWYNENNILL
jgi:hypothetical protein